MIKFNKWALAAANAVAVFYTVSAAALYFWGENAVCFVEKIHFVKFSNDMVTFQVTAGNFVSGLITHYVAMYVFVALVIVFHDRLKLNKFLK